MKVGSLFAEIGFKVDQKGIDTFTNAMKSFQNTIRSGLKDLKEYAKVAREIADTARNLYIPTQQEARSRYRANTAYIRSTSREKNAWAKQTKALTMVDTAKAALLFKKAKTQEQDSNTRALNAQSRAKQIEQKERGLIGTHTGKYSAGIIQLLRGILGFNIGGIAGGVAGLAGLAHPIVAAISAGVGAIVAAINIVTKTVREGVRTGMSYRDYMAFTGRSTRSISGLMGAALNTTNMTPEDVMRDVLGLEKGYWDMFFGGGNPRFWQMIGELPTGRGDVDLRKILNAVYRLSGGFENAGLARSMLAMAGLSEEYITLVQDIKRNNPEVTFDELFSRTREQISLIEDGNKTLREYDRAWAELKVELARFLLDSGFLDVLKELVDILREFAQGIRQFMDWWNGEEPDTTRDTIKGIKDTILDVARKSNPLFGGYDILKGAIDRLGIGDKSMQTNSFMDNSRPVIYVGSPEEAVTVAENLKRQNAEDFFNGRYNHAYMEIR